MNISGMVRTAQILEDSNLYSEGRVENFRRDPDSAREYIESIKSKGKS